MYREKLIEFMKRKARRLLEFGVEGYFTDEDAQAILRWSEDDCLRVWEELKTRAVRDYGLTSDTCPFCIKHYGCCAQCEYAKNHGVCHDDASDYSRIMFEVNDLEVFPLGWYDSTLKELSDETG